MAKQSRISNVSEETDLEGSGVLGAKDAEIVTGDDVLANLHAQGHQV